MTFNYKIFKEHIINFNCENYLTEKSAEFKSLYNDFYIFYVKLIKDEIEKTKQLNAKFSKNINDKNDKNDKNDMENMEHLVQANRFSYKGNINNYQMIKKQLDSNLPKLDFKTFMKMQEEKKNKNKQD